MNHCWSSRAQELTSTAEEQESIDPEHGHDVVELPCCPHHRELWTTARLCGDGAVEDDENGADADEPSYYFRCTRDAVADSDDDDSLADGDAASFDDGVGGSAADDGMGIPWLCTADDAMIPTSDEDGGGEGPRLDSAVDGGAGDDPTPSLQDSPDDGDA